jgi:hypothetical protein
MIHVPSGFYVFAGGLLVLSGILQLWMRLRDRGERRLFDLGLVFSLFSIGIGALVIYFGLVIHR